LTNKRHESLILALLAYVAFDLLAHWHPGLRGSFEFLPRENGGDVNEFVTLWLAEFSRNVRELGFRATFYWVNPWSVGGFYTSHPGGLTFLTAVWQNLFGEAPDTLRRLAILFFAVRLGLFHSLVARAYGFAAARVAFFFYLLVPTTQTYTHALSFEVISGTLVLAAFWARAWWARALLMASAGLVDWTALLALPVFLWFSPRRFASLWLIAVPLCSQFYWSRATGGGGEQLSRLYMYLVGPYHVLRENPEAVAMLWRAVLLSFPIPVLLFFFFDLFRHGVRKREPWFYAAILAGGAFLVMFLGVFRVHPYASQLLILPLCAAAGRGFLELFPSKKLRALVLVPLILSSLWWSAYPFQSRENAETRVTLRQEAEKIAALLAGSRYSIHGDLRFLRPEPLPLYLGAFGARERKDGCAKFTVHYRSVMESHPEAQFIGNFLLLTENDCAR